MLVRPVFVLVKVHRLEKLWTSTYALFVEEGVLVRLVYVMRQIKSAEEFCFQISCVHLYHGTVVKLASS